VATTFLSVQSNTSAASDLRARPGAGIAPVNAWFRDFTGKVEVYE
jgi:hypothetical protein